MIKVSEEVVVVADSSKIGKLGFTLIAPLQKVHKLITGTGADKAFVEELKNRGIEIFLSP